MSNYYLEERLPRKESCSLTELKESFLKVIDKINKFEEVYKPKGGAKANFEYQEDDKGHKYITVVIQYESSREDEASRLVEEMLYSISKEWKIPQQYFVSDELKENLKKFYLDVVLP